jgi:serine/threonine protein kinase
LSKRNGLLQAEGTFKRVTDAVEVAPFKDSASAQRVVRSVSKEDHEITDKELELERQYGKILSWARYDAKHRHETKTMILQEGFDNDLYLYTKYTPANERQKLPLNELVEVLLQVGETLQEMHADGYVHRDFKVKNVLYRKGTDGKVEAKLIDFGHSYRPDHERYPRKRAKGYGTLRYTSPEALEFPKDISDPRLLAQAEDMYAIGCLIYEIYFQKELPWGSDTYKACKKDDPDGERRERAIKLQKRETTKLLDMSRDREGTLDGDILFIMSRLLEPNPRRRIKMPALLEALKRLQTNLNP